MFSSFTKKYFDYFLKNKYNLDDNNILVLLLNSEKEKIFDFIKNTKLNINVDVDYSINNILKYCKSYFVDKNINLELKDLNQTILVSWNNYINNYKNKIIIKTENINIEILLLKIKIIIYMIEYLGNNKNLNIILILSKLKKHAPNRNEIINVEHINSGYSYDNTIVIWRYEEFEKVFFHEIIHVLRLDKREDNTDEIINTEFHNYFEAITDFYAIIYHIIYLSLITNINPKLFLEIELGFIKNQAMNITSILDLNDFSFNEKMIVKQKSSAFSYYIIKYLLFEYIIKLNIKNLLSYLKQINYNILLNNIINNKFIKYNYYNIKSLRMTLFQLKY